MTPPGCRPVYRGGALLSMPTAYTRTSLSRIIRFKSLMLVWLLVSLPSEITTSAFFL